MSAIEPTDETGAAVAVSPEEAEDFKPSPAELVAPGPDDVHGTLVVLDRHDELAIIEEFQRRALEVMLYDVPKGGERLIDLSYAGVNEAVRLLNTMGGLRIGVVEGTLEVVTEHYDVGDGPEPFFVATIAAREAKTDYLQYGTASEPQWMKLTDRTIARYKREKKPVREDGKVFDVFARAKAINKAQRNALKVQIPETMRQTMIATYKGDTAALRQIQAGQGAAELAKLPPPLPEDDERANELRGRVRELYQEIRAVDVLKVLPAQYHAYLTRAEGSYEKLEGFVGYLEQRLAEARQEASIEGTATDA